MNRQELEEFFNQFTKEMTGLVVKKNADYTSADEDAFRNFKTVEKMGICSPETGFLVRMCDKFMRIISLSMGKSHEIKAESLKDTLLDLANYSILMAGYFKSLSEDQKNKEILNVSDEMALVRARVEAHYESDQSQDGHQVMARKAKV
jgi:hypothetical protein